MASTQPKTTTFILDAKSIDRENYTVRGIFSTEAEDRHREIVLQDGWELKNFMANPVVLFGHNHWDLPVGQVIELAVESVDGKKCLVGTIQFAVEEYELAKTIFNLYAGKYMRAFSVGFRNLDYTIEYDEESDRSTVYLTSNELLELSCVPIPANAEALVKAANDGVDLDAYRKGIEKYQREITSEDSKSTDQVSNSDLAKVLKTVVDTLEQIDATMKATKATDASDTEESVDGDAQTKSGKTASPVSKGSVKKAKQSEKVLRGKAKHSINRAIRALAETKGKL